VQKKKILFISDHPLSTSGVGCQARYLIEGLLRTGKYQFRCLGAAIKHGDYRIVNVPPNPNDPNRWNDGDWLIRPIDGFGDKNTMRLLLAQEKPDAVFLFTDPRFFMHYFEIEDEIHQICPMVWWHVWDNDPWPAYNKAIYDSIDLCNCHSYKTYSLVSEHYPEITNFIPHAVPPEIFYPMKEEEISLAKENLLGAEKKDHFVALWINRNAKRKMPGDVIDSWHIFLKQLEEKYGHKNATLLMHTNPLDQEGPNLYKIVEHFNLVDNVVFSTDRIGFPQVNMLHNISDTYISISSNEGFGLGTLESMMTATPIIALKTGGMTRQVVDHRDGSHNGIALDPEVRNLVGSQLVPYIYEDHISNQTFANAIMEMYEYGPEKRKELGKKALDYANYEFNLNETVEKWDKTLFETIEGWKDKRKPWECQKL